MRCVGTGDACIIAQPHERPVCMRNALLLIAIALGTAGCGILYRQPIYQGNLVQPDAVAQLQVGMGKQQVLALLGTPSIEDPFHHDRWDYTSTQRRGRSGGTEVKNFVVYFQNDGVTRWEGDYFPDQDDVLAKRAIKDFGPNLRKDKKKDR